LKRILAITLFCLIASIAFSTKVYSARQTPSTEDRCQFFQAQLVSPQAHEMMIKNKLILENDELEMPLFGWKSKWDLYKLVQIKDRCIAVMSICTFRKGDRSCEGKTFDAFALATTDKVDIYEFEDFQKALDLPSEVIAKIGDIDIENQPGYYYAKFSGESAAFAQKSFLTQTRYGGFMGTVELGSKADFDSTENRNWKVIEASFSPRRDFTSEPLDIQSYQLDGLGEKPSEAYWSACSPPDLAPVNGPQQCLVGPWSQAFVLDLFSAN
jgi:hypothetical protein